MYTLERIAVVEARVDLIRTQSGRAAARATGCILARTIGPPRSERDKARDTTLCCASRSRPTVQQQRGVVHELAPKVKHTVATWAHY